MSEKNVTSINLYCANCGTKLGGAKDVCPSCGRVIGPEQYAAIPRTGAAGVGYSEITGHPTFDAYRKHTGKVQMILLPIIAVVVFVILLLIGAGAAVSLVSAALLLAIMFAIAAAKGRKKPDWQGTVEKKEFTRIKRQGADRYTYKVWFRGEDGKRRTHVWHQHSYVYDYLEEGDTVRFLGSLGTPNAFEKYDKSGDDVIPCVCCGNLADPRYPYCTACGAILLKGKTAQ